MYLLTIIIIILYVCWVHVAFNITKNFTFSVIFFSNTVRQNQFTRSTYEVIRLGKLYFFFERIEKLRLIKKSDMLF